MNNSKQKRAHGLWSAHHAMKHPAATPEESLTPEGYSSRETQPWSYMPHNATGGVGTGPGQAGPSFAQEDPAEAHHGNLASHSPTKWGGRVELAQRWLLFMRHCATCKGGCEHGERCRWAGRGEASLLPTTLFSAQAHSLISLYAVYFVCRSGRALWSHMINCDASNNCRHPKCSIVKSILKHHKSCKCNCTYSS